MSTQKKGISSELIAQKYFNKNPDNMVFVPLLGLGAIDIVVINKKTKKITLYDVKTISRRTRSYAKSDEKMIIYRPLKAIQKRLGVRHIYVDEKTEKVIIPNQNKGD